MKLTWLGHACFFLETEEGSAVFDPYMPGSVPGIELPQITADAVICSHGHRDHCYAEGIRLSGHSPDFSVKQYSSFHDDEHGKKRGENLITVIDAEKQRVVHLGDLGHTLSPELLSELGYVDVLMIPVGGFYTVNAITALEIVKKISPRITVPMHYRGNGFGYDVISTVDEFTAGAENAKIIDCSSLEITPETEAMTAVLRCPIK